MAWNNIFTMIETDPERTQQPFQKTIYPFNNYEFMFFHLVSPEQLESAFPEDRNNDYRKA